MHLMDVVQIDYVMEDLPFSGLQSPLSHASPAQLEGLMQNVALRQV